MRPIRWPRSFLASWLGAALFCGGAAVASPPLQLKLVLQAPAATGVDSVMVSPDGSLVSFAAGEGGVRLYDARTGAMLRAIGDVGGRDVSFSPDGKTITGAGFHMDKLVGIYDVQTGKRLLALPGHTEWEAYASALSPDGKLLASTGADKQILVWELATGKLRIQLKDQPTNVAALAFSPDSATLASGGGDKMVHLWDSATGQLRRSLPGHRDWVCAIAFSPDGKAIASASCDWGFHRGHDWPRPVWRGREQCEWRLWDAASGKPLRVTAGPGRLLSLAFAPDGKSLVCGIDREVRLYDLAAEVPGRVLTTHYADVTSVAFMPDGSAVLSASHDQTVKRTNVSSGKVEWRLPGYFEQVNSVAISGDASLLVTGVSDHRYARRRMPAAAEQAGPGAVRLWDARTGRLMRRLGDPAQQIMAVAISRDKRYVAAGGSGGVRVWDAATGASLWSTPDHANEVLAVAFSPDGKSFAAGWAGGAITLHDVASGNVGQRLEAQNGGVTSLTFSPDGNVLYCGEARGGTSAWNPRTGQAVRTFQPPNPQADSFTIDRLMNSVSLSRDGRVLAACASSVNDEFVDPVRIWDASTGSPIRDFSAENIHGRPMALSPDGSLIATGGKSVKLWDARTGKMVRDLMGHLKRTQSIVFSADGRMLVAGGSYGTTNAWEVASGRLLVTLFAFAEDHNGVVADDWLAYHPDGFYDGSPGVERYLAWRVGDEFKTPDTIGRQLHRPDLIQSALKLRLP